MLSTKMKLNTKEKRMGSVEGQVKALRSPSAVSRTILELEQLVRGWEGDNVLLGQRNAQEKGTFHL